jgi:uncharacterized damage-inducible protein DinB
MDLSNQSSILKDNADFLYLRLFKTLEGLTSEEAKWTPTKEANNIEWQLNHLSRITNLNIPRLITENKEWEPDNWPSNYKEADLESTRLIEDIRKGSVLVSELLEKLTDDQLEKDTKYWGGTRKFEEGLFAYLAEIAHHKGQIAYLRGTYAREHGAKWKYP